MNTTVGPNVDTNNSKSDLLPAKVGAAAKPKLDLKALNRKPALGEYTDFRIYLHDFYQYKRTESLGELRPYTYAHFSAAADVKSPNYLKLIIEGRRNLSKLMIKKFSKALGHTKEETLEFEALVLYGQEKSPVLRNNFLKRLSEIRMRYQIKRGELQPETFERISSWINWALLAMADQEGVTADPEALRECLRQKSSIDEIQRSLKTLISSGQIVVDDSGNLQRGKSGLPSGEEIPVELVRKIQAEFIYLALESLFQDRPQEREFGALTVSLTEKEFEQMKFEVRQLRKKWMKDFSVHRQQQKGDRVFQINFQLFPISRMTK
ncbi:MAG: TIGR02147 family protein [Bdellovibrionales bacterium]|nr:TIGR02147 family protein [Bdellovibrionales bacterium]